MQKNFDISTLGLMNSTAWSEYVLYNFRGGGITSVLYQSLSLQVTLTVIVLKFGAKMWLLKIMWLSHQL